MAGKKGMEWEGTVEALYEDHPEMFTMKEVSIEDINDDFSKKLDYALAEIYQKEYKNAHPITFTSLGLKRC